MAVRLAALRAGRALLPRKVFGSLLVAESTKESIMRHEGLGKLEKCVDAVGSGNIVRIASGTGSVCIFMETSARGSQLDLLEGASISYWTR
jgi:hypothetical protein